MNEKELVSLKLEALRLAHGDIVLAKGIFDWLVPTNPNKVGASNILVAKAVN